MGNGDPPNPRDMGVRIPRDPNEVTLGELYRGFVDLRFELNRRLDDLNRRLETRVVSTDLYNISMTNMQKEIDELSRRGDQLAANRRALITGVLVAMASGIASFIFNIFSSVKIH